jgi:hypothetical protein
MSEETEKVIELDLGYTPEAAVSGAVLVQSERSTFLTFNAMRLRDDGYRVDAGTALVEFPFCIITQFGYPNDEALPGHPLYAFGLKDYGYGIFEVLNSSWRKRIDDQNRISFPRLESYTKRSRHFIITFHDSTFECLARDIQLEIIGEPYERVFARIGERVINE